MDVLNIPRLAYLTDFAPKEAKPSGNYRGSSDFWNKKI